MASVMRYTALTTIASCMTVEMNDLVAASNAVGSALDNSASHYLYGSFELLFSVTGSYSASAPYCSFYLIKSLDGTNYEYGTTAIDPPTSTFRGVFQGYAAASGTAFRVTIDNVLIPNLLFQPVIVNDNAVAFAGSGNQMRVRFHSQEMV